MLLNKAERQVMKVSLNAEKKILDELTKLYEQCAKDCRDRIEVLELRPDLRENMQTIIYQQKYQQIILKQIEDVLQKLHNESYETVEEYLHDCYENGYIGTMYSIQSQGIPLTIPIDQKAVTKAIQIDSKLSKPLYEEMGDDITILKNTVRAEVSRGIAEGKSWIQIAERLARGIERRSHITPFHKALNRTMTIARTEGHRVQEQAVMDGAYVARDAGADELRQWDSALDSKVRDWHREADGQIRELDEPFEVGGEKLMKPGDGSAKNAINCRCHLLLRARWTLGEEELEVLKERAIKHGFVDEDGNPTSKSYLEYKQKFLKLPENADKIGLSAEGLTIEVYHSKKESLKKEFSDLKMKSFAMRRSNDETAKKAHFERLKKINDELIELDKEWAKVSSSIVQNKMTETFGVLKDVRNIEQIVKKVNPNFLKGSEYQNNCGYCSVTYDAIRRGFNVEANPKMCLSVSEWKQMWKEFEPITVQAKRKKSALEEIKKEVVSWGNGSRGTIFVQWDGRTIGHFFNIENENGVVRFIDGQNGSSNCEEYFEDVKPSSIIYGRTDNLALTEKTFEAMKKGSDENE